MKRTTKYKLMSGILAGTIFFGGFVHGKNTVYASEPIQDKTTSLETTITTEPTDSILETEPETTPIVNETPLTKEEFLNNIDDKLVKKFYTQLYELYDFEAFNSRSAIPQYFQTIYGDKFSCGTIQSAGCGISSLAMVSSYLFDEIITPDLMKVYDSGPSPAAAFEKAIKRLNLNCVIHRGQAAIDNIDKALEEGHPVIGLMGRHSIFTERGHFILFVGKTEDGKYIINDPNLENYYKPSMIDGYTNGFTKEQATKGLNGIYIFDTKKEFIDARDTILSISNSKKSSQIEVSENYIGQTTKETELRSGPSESHPIITNLSLNETIIKLFTNNNGCDLVKSNEYIGYIKSNAITYSKDIKENIPNHIKCNDIVITTSTITLKNAPTSQSETITTIQENEEVEVIALVDNGWLLVKYNGNIGYIEKTYTLSILEQIQKQYPELNITEINPNKVAYLSTKTDIRKGNSIEFDSIGTIDKYETVRILCEYKNWSFVLTNERSIGFISNRYLKELPDKFIELDKSTNKLTYYNNGKKIYTISANGNIKYNGIYPIVDKNIHLTLSDQNGQLFSSATLESKESQYQIQTQIYNDIEEGNKVIIHR